MLEDEINWKWEVVDGVWSERIPDVKKDTNNEEILWMLTTFITTM